MSDDAPRNDDTPRPTTTTDSGIPVASDEHSLTVGPNGPDRAARRLSGPEDAALQPRARPRAGRPRQGQRSARLLRGDRGRHPVDQRRASCPRSASARRCSRASRTSPARWAARTRSATRAASPSSSTPRRATTTSSATTRPTFFIRDAIKFADFIHSQKRMPDTGLRSNDMQWDFWTLSPETAHQVTILMSDRGTPRSYRHMNGYSSHTYSWMNAAGERFWVKYHFKTVQGIENFTLAEADAMAGEDPDFHRRDLWDAIAAGDAPEWRLEMQIMPFEEAADYRFNPFDLTKVWPHADYPPITIGRMVLDRNPENHFAEVEQAGFAPAQARAGHRAEPGQDADGPDLLLPRHAPAPDRRELRAAADQRAEVPRALLQQGRRDDLPPRRVAARLRAQLLRRAAGRSRQGAARLVGRGGRDRPLRVRAARRRRRLRPAPARSTAT